MEAGDVIDLIALVMFGIIMLAAFQSVGAAEQRLTDQHDKAVIFIDQMRSVTCLDFSPAYLVLIFRQSGYAHSDHLAFSLDEAFRKASSTLRRAKIDAVLVRDNSPNRFEAVRLFHNHRGRAEGKRVGSVTIVPLPEEDGDTG